MGIGHVLIPQQKEWLKLPTTAEIKHGELL
jgi:hypothetical protein